MADETGNNSIDSIASRIIKEREKRKWSQKTLVEKTGLRSNEVYQAENGGVPTVEELERFAKAFGIQVEDLTRGLERTRFSAPLGKAVKITVVVSSLVMVAISFLPHWPVVIVLYAVYLSCLLLSVQGYAIENDTLIVKRLLWKTKIPLAGMTSAVVDKSAMKRSFRLLGNGGLFAYVGRFRNPSIGNYKAYVTDMARCVILKIGKRTIVVSPDDPESFAKAAQRLIKA